jgi:DNA-binding PadR family transcriptional regulator
MATRASASDRLVPAEYHVLLALAAGERHIDSIPGDVEHLSMGKIALEIPLLRAVLRRLARAGLIVSTESRDTPHDLDHVHFQITRDGERRLSKETEHMARIMRAQDPVDD